MDQQQWESLPDAVVVTDADGTVLACNARAHALLGLAGDAVGRALADLVELHGVAGETCHLPPPPPRLGDRIPERVVYVALGSHRRPLSVTGRFGDGRWVLLLRATGRREALERLHGDVVATVSHEIRSPLTSVKGFTRTLLGRWDRFSDEQKRAMLETIDADADRVTQLLLDLLEVSRIDAGRVALRRRPVDLGALVSDVACRLREQHPGERDVRVTIAPDLPVLHADAARLEQVVTNLVGNALRHAPGADVDVEVAADDGHLELTIADDGPGIDRDLARVVFTKFGRGRQTRHAGTGLGLFIARGLVTAHGGTVELLHGPPGATFRVRLPVEDTTA